MWPTIKTVIFTVVVEGFLTVLLPYPWLRIARPISAFTYLGFACVVVGAAGYFWCAGLFSFLGKGTPAYIDPPAKFVARGLYKRCRNPIYVSVLLVIAGEALIARSWWLAAYVCGLALIYHLIVIFHEEPSLTRRFGAMYTGYCGEVPRWIPRLRPN
ncbi:MAG TPA: isoprenylcysteine carboxylmethyltransferase family protein [Terriglobales bacterium]|nr:isoprenylcysteine carboxylmethyltransferase family protein [Terriglobales bacterium]